jgi:FkbM family methyltransferase
MTLLTVELEHALTIQSENHINNVKNHLHFTPLIIADIGANVGHYTKALLNSYPSASVHSYEPHPHNLNELYKIKNNRLHIYDYGLFDTDSNMNIGMREDGRNNNGTYGIYTTENSTTVQFKNANNELIRPDFIKMDVEGSELYILHCEDFLKNTKGILIELVYMDNFKQNSNIRLQLQKLGFEFLTNISKNDELWTKK